MFDRNSFGQPTVIYLLSICTILISIFLLVTEFKQAEATIKKYFFPSLLFKIGCGIGMGFLYSHYYPSGDTYSFFEDGKQIASLALLEPAQFFKFLWNGSEDFGIWNHLNYHQPRALFFSKVTAVGYLLSFGSYWGIAVFFSFVSFFSAWKLVDKIVAFFPDVTEAAVIAFLFFPSVVFWSSGLMKESIAMTGLYAVVYVFLTGWVQNKIRFSDGAMLLVGCWLLWNLKYYYAGVLLISFSMVASIRILLAKRPTLTIFTLFFLSLIVLVLPLLLVTQLHPNFYPSRILEVIVKNYEAYQGISKPANMISYYQLSPTPMSMLLNMPWAFVSGVFRPFIWEGRSFFQVVTGIENLGVLVLFLGMVKRIRKIPLTANGLLIVGMLVYIALLAILLALSTPNLGTLVRYRVGYYPFLVFLLLLSNPWIWKRNRLLSK